MNIRLLGIVIIAAVVSGCSPVTHRGSVAMKISENEAHVCLGQGEVIKGDQIVILRNVCKQDLNIGASKSVLRNADRCQLVKVGGGVIADVLNEHYSIATIDPGVEYREGDIVEKLK